ncbi:MAG: porin family protein [Chlorobiaceae bacterium]|nr:porin family protein [Chlorobiaceae bacterium]
MKKFILPLLVAGLFAVPSPAQAETNPYVSISGGLGLMTNSTVDGEVVEYQSGYLVNAALGLKTDYVRLEAEVGYHNNDIDTWDGDPAIPGSNISIWSFMANGYFDYNMNDSEISPYIMVGLGYANVTGDDGSVTFDDGVFAWQAGAGVGFKAADKVTIDVGYRYFSASDADLGGDVFSIASHNILAGVRIDF